MEITYSTSQLYDKIQKSNNRYVADSYTTKKTLSLDEPLSGLKDEAEVFQNRARKLKHYKTSTHQDSKIIRNINNFVKEYNAFQRKAKKTGDVKFEKKYEELEKLVEEYKKPLKRVGVTIGKTGGLGFNSEDFDKVSKKDLQTLFSGSDSFIEKASKSIRKLQNYAENNEYKEEYYRFRPTVNYTEGQMASAALSSSMITILNQEKGKAELETASYKAFDQEGFQSTYNGFMLIPQLKLDTELLKNIEEIKELTKEYEDQFSKLGFSINEESYKLDYSEENVADEEQANNAYKELFGSDAEYQKNLSEICRKIFKGSLKTDSIGVNIDYSL